jgi:D-glycerate 3-kinase
LDKVTALETTLRSPPYNLPTLTLSIDDLYLPRSAQVELAASHPHNPLIQHRGEPSTHDMTLGLELFRALKSKANNIRIPSYDKSLHDGKGDRLPETAWRVINSSGEEPVEVVIFEGWCVGFRSLSPKIVEEKWNQSREEGSKVAGQVESRLAQQTLENVQFINDALQQYDELTE